MSPELLCYFWTNACELSHRHAQKSQAHTVGLTDMLILY